MERESEPAMKKVSLEVPGRFADISCESSSKMASRHPSKIK